LGSDIVQGLTVIVLLYIMVGH